MSRDVADIIRTPVGKERALTLRDLLSPITAAAITRAARVCTPDCTLGELTERQRAEIAKAVA